MSLAAISDVHIKDANDDRTNLLLTFLTHEKVKGATNVVLLGDIFDLMVGPHEEYLSKYDRIFKELAGFCQSGKNVLYFEGNHDFHLTKLFERARTAYRMGDRLKLYSSDKVMEISGCQFYLCHGDNIEIGNAGYRIYKSLVNNVAMEYVANNVVPYSLLHAIGEYASEKSRQRNQQKYTPTDETLMEEVRDKFRESAGEVWQKNPEVDLIMAGHSHVKDLHQVAKNCVYVNNGFAPKTRTFIHVSEAGKVEFISLD